MAKLSDVRDTPEIADDDASHGRARGERRDGVVVLHVAGLENVGGGDLGRLIE